SIQRFSMRRLGLALLVLLALLVVVPSGVTWAVRTDRINTALCTSDIRCLRQEALWLMAQAVPSSPVVPCLELAPASWSLNTVRAGSGVASIVFRHMQALPDAAGTLEPNRACDLAGMTEVSSEQPGARRYIRIDRTATPVKVTRSYAFSGGCISE